MKIQLFLFATLYVAISSQYEITPIWKNNLLTTIPLWGKEYQVSFEIKPGTKHHQYASIVHFTNGVNCCNAGNRIPGIWFIPNTLKLLVTSAVNGNGNVEHRESKDLPVNKFTRVVVQQFQDNKGAYVYAIIINGKVVRRITNSKPVVYKNIKVYAGSPWYSAADAVLRNLQYKVKPEFQGNIKRGRLLRTLPVWGKEWRVRFQVKPLSAQKPWSNILHFTTGADNAALGSRIPAVWMHPGNKKLVVYTQLGNKKDWSWSSPMELTVLKYMNVHIEQVKDKSGKYYLRILLNGKVYINQHQTKPTNYKNVKLFVSDPWYIPADVHIKNLHLEGISGSHFYTTL